MTPKDPIHTILNDIRHIVRVLRLASRASEADCGLSAAQLFVLRQLEGVGGLSINELACHTMTHQSSVSAVVKKLVEQGLATRQVCPEDSRRVEVSLTPAGRARLRKAPAPVQEKLVEALRRMPSKDQEELATRLGRLVEEAGFRTGDPPMLFEETSSGSTRTNVRRKR